MISTTSTTNLCRPKRSYRSVAFRTWNVGEASRIYARQPVATAAVASAAHSSKLSDSSSSVTAVKMLGNEMNLLSTAKVNLEERTETKAQRSLNRSLQNVASISGQNTLPESICAAGGELAYNHESLNLTLPKRRHKSVEFGTQYCTVNKMGDPRTSNLAKLGTADCYSSSEYVQYSAKNDYENVNVGECKTQRNFSNMPTNQLNGFTSKPKIERHIVSSQFATNAPRADNDTDDEGNDAAEASTSSSFKFYSSEQREKSRHHQPKFRSQATIMDSKNRNSQTKSKKHFKFRGASAENSLSERMTQSSNSQMFPVYGRNNKHEQIGGESAKLLRISDNYRSLMNMSGTSAMTPRPKPHFVVDPGAANLSKSKDTTCITNSARTKSLDNMSKFGVMSNSYCEQSHTTKEKSAKNSGTFNYAKSLLRKLYSNSASKFRNANEKCAISTREKCGEFDSAMSPFFQIRLPEPEELPYLPYNVHYQVEDEYEDDDESDTDTECAEKFPTIAESFKLTEKLKNSVNHYSSPDEGVHLSCSASSSNSTNSTTLNPLHSNGPPFNSQGTMNKSCRSEYALRSTDNGTLIRERRKLSQEYSNSQNFIGRTDSVVSRKRSDVYHNTSSPISYQPTVNNKTATKLEIVTTLPRDNFISLNHYNNNNNTDENKEEFGKKPNLDDPLLLCESYLNDCASPQDSSSLGYSTMSSSGYTIGNELNIGAENDYGTPLNSLHLKSATTLTQPKFSSTVIPVEHKNSRSSSVGPRTALQTKQQQPNYKLSNAIINNPKVGSLNGLNDDDNLQDAEKKFANWNELFQFLKNEISEMRARDTQIWNNLTNIEKEICNSVPQRGPTR